MAEMEIVLRLSCLIFSRAVVDIFCIPVWLFIKVAVFIRSPCYNGLLRRNNMSVAHCLQISLLLHWFQVLWQLSPLTQAYICHLDGCDMIVIRLTMTDGSEVCSLTDC